MGPNENDVNLACEATPSDAEASVSPSAGAPASTPQTSLPFTADRNKRSTQSTLSEAPGKKLRLPINRSVVFKKKHVVMNVKENGYL